MSRPSPPPSWDVGSAAASFPVPTEGRCGPLSGAALSEAPVVTWAREGPPCCTPILPVCQKLLSWTSSLVAMWPDSGDWGWSGGVDPPKDQTPLHLHPDPVAMLTKREGVPVPLKSWPGQGRLHGASWSCHKAWAGAVAAVSLGATAPLEPVLPSEETEKRGGGGSRELKARQARASSDPRRWL